MALVALPLLSLPGRLPLPGRPPLLGGSEKKSKARPPRLAVPGPAAAGPQTFAMSTPRQDQVKTCKHYIGSPRADSILSAFLDFNDSDVHADDGPPLDFDDAMAELAARAAAKGEGPTDECDSSGSTRCSDTGAICFNVGADDEAEDHAAEESGEEYDEEYDSDFESESECSDSEAEDEEQVVADTSSLGCSGTNGAELRVLPPKGARTSSRGPGARRERSSSRAGTRRASSAAGSRRCSESAAGAGGAEGGAVARASSRGAGRASSRGAGRRMRPPALPRPAEELAKEQLSAGVA
eukprot:CAMPEP_0177184790 /NCGR_PEP_ID=MMETSP0367-20130122/17750_1 /TAXON_ID=447022 ORGANISM="Scrippsiella hangoei-like, Strain SHHI-4" /NCGR_SAMPLE_ID=MMETSP0367 /ASSEMBLY_ACC=CAM_ASM_000362 /LENGTH=295 /DNA_ID=CAMNT_0018631939 /DNA_START=76 /DNA_END=963 /DNA_ORIENTATION=+